MSPARVVESCILVMSYVICDDYIQKYLYNSTVNQRYMSSRNHVVGGGEAKMTSLTRRGGGWVAKVTSFVSFKSINLICFPLCHLFQTLLFPTSCRTLQAHEELFSWMEITWNVGNKDPLAHIKKSSRTQSR